MYVECRKISYYYSQKTTHNSLLIATQYSGPRMFLCFKLHIVTNYVLNYLVKYSLNLSDPICMIDGACA